MPKNKTRGPVLNAPLMESIVIDGVVIDLPTYDDLMATYGRSARGHRLVKGYEALLLAVTAIGKAIDTAHRKASHGCYDVACSECDGDGQGPTDLQRYRR